MLTVSDGSLPVPTRVCKGFGEAAESAARAILLLQGLSRVQREQLQLQLSDKDAWRQQLTVLPPDHPRAAELQKELGAFLGRRERTQREGNMQVHTVSLLQLTEVARSLTK